MIGVDLSPAHPLDAGAVARIMGLAQQTLPWLPRIYSAAEDIRHSDQMIAAGWVTIARYDNEIVGFSAEENGYIHSLYLHPLAQGKGIASSLLDALKSGSNHLRLNSYQQNSHANHFYRRAGFVEVSKSDGQDNDVGLPDIQFEWQRERAA